MKKHHENTAFANRKSLKALWLVAITIVLSMLMALVVAAETEDNDEWTSANTFVVGDSISGKLGEEDDVDFYQFYVSNPGTLTLVFDHTDMVSEDYYWVVTLYDAQQKQISKQWIPGNGTSYQLYDIHVTGGTYYIHIKANQGYYSNTTYTLKTSVVYDFITNKDYNGELEYGWVKDSFEFPVNNDCYLTFYGYAKSSGLSASTNYWKFTLYDSTGNYIYAKEISGDTQEQSSPKIGLSAGWYTIVVSKSNVLTTTEYGLRAETVNDNYWEKEKNETIATATPITNGYKYTGTVTESGDQDYYKVTLNTDGVVNLDFTHAYYNSDSNYWNIAIMNDKSEIYKSYDISGKQDVFSSAYVGLPAGTYYIRVRCYAYDTYSPAYWATPYTITLNFESSTQWEKEYNENINSATSIQLNQAYSGTVRTENDQDYYKFTLLQDGKIVLDFSHEYYNDDDKCWNIAIMNERSEIFKSYDIDEQTDKYSLPTIGLPAGTYYIRVRCYNYGTYSWIYWTTPYTFTVNYEASTQWEKEFNETIDSATAIQLNQSYNGTVVNETDQDFYKFILWQDGTIVLDFAHDYYNDETKRWTVTILNERSEEFVSYNITDKTDQFSSTTLGLSAGTYYIRIRCYNYGTYSWAYRTIPYTFTVNFEASTQWEKEFNNNFSTATPIQLNKLYHGVIMKNDDTDCYKIENPSVNTLVFTFEHYQSTSKNNCYSISLLDSRENVLKSATVKLSDNAITLTYEDAPAGVYYIKIAPSSYYSTEPYSIVLATPHTCSGYFKTVTPAGCLTSGWRVKRCSTCDVLLEEEYVPAHGHYFSSYTSLDANEHKRFCSACGIEETSGHEWGLGEVTVAATCKTTGEQTIRCTFCAHEITKVIPMLTEHNHSEWIPFDSEQHQSTCECGEIVYSDHDWNSGEITESATHLTEGKIKYSCLSCGAYKVNTLPKTETHSYGEWEKHDNDQHRKVCACGDIAYEAHIMVSTIEQEPTCLADGYRTEICSTCGYTQTVVIPATGHIYSEEWTIDIAAGCVTTGSKSHHCMFCDANKDVTEILANGHTFCEWATKTNPTCDAPGEEHRKCSVCNLTESREGASALGHNYEIEWTVDKASTCIEVGSKSHHCTRCGNKNDITTIDATGHQFEEWTVSVNATCSEGGKETRTCSICKATDDRDTIALGHNYEADWTVDTAPTCTEGGSKSHHCTRCGNKNDITAIEATGHQFEEWTVSVNATCTEGGKETRACSICKRTDERETIAIGHSYLTEWTIDEEATCTQAGSKSHHCTHCGDKNDVTPIEMTSHTFDSWKTIQEATTNHTGIQERTCVCGETETSTIEKVEGLTNGGAAAIAASSTAVGGGGIAAGLWWFLKKKKMIAPK